MPFVYHRKPAIRHSIPGSEAFALGLIFIPTLVTSSLQVKLFNKSIRTCMNEVQTPLAPAEAKDDANKFLKPRNPNSYYNHLHIEY